MKAKMKAIFLAVCVVAVVCIFVSKKREAIKDSITLMNVEALAGGETGGTCMGSGSIHCPYSNDNVYFVR